MHPLTWRYDLIFDFDSFLTTISQNVWLWTADHQLDSDQSESQIDVFSGRGILIEGENVWLVGTASEHHAIYQYRVNGASNVYMGLIQTETPYYQPNPGMQFNSSRIICTDAS